MDERKRLTWRGKLALVVLGPLVVFGLLEVGLRIGGFRYEPWRAQLENRSCEELRQRSLYEPHPDLLWTLRPSTVLDLPYLGFAGISTNAAGLRGRELPGPKAPGEIRILALGDSVSFCLGLPEGETWENRMEQALRAAPELSGREVAVVNAAVPGYSSVQGLRLFEKLRSLEPDVVVFWFGLSDSHPMRDLPDSAQTLPVEGVSRALAALWELRVFQLVERLVTAARQRAAEGTRVSRAEFRGNVERLRDLERSGGPRILFVREPERCDVTIAQLERVVARAEEEGAEVVLGPRKLLTWIAPAPEGADLTGKSVPWLGKPAILFEPQPAAPDYQESDEIRSLAEVRADLEQLRQLKRSLDGMLEGLPEGSLGYRDLFGHARPDEVFVDNCHLTALGARLTGEALARAALETLRR